MPRRELDARWSTLAGRTVTWLDEVHGTEVLIVDEPGRHIGAAADAVVTARPGAALGVWVGDCAPVALVADEGVVALVHAGWRGLAAGVVERSVETMRGLGGRDVQALLGPCIHAACYEFSPTDLDGVAGRLGEAARGATAWGTPALDVPGALRALLGLLGIALDTSASCCTACTPGYWSHRARGDLGRQGAVAFLEDL